MQWNVVERPPQYALDRLASLRVEAPTNARNSDSIGLLVSLWCGRVRSHILVGGQPLYFSYGFKIGEVAVHAKEGSIAVNGRFQKEFYRKEITSTTKKSRNLDGKGGLSLTAGFASILSYLPTSISGELSLAAGQHSIDSSDGKYFHVLWRVADSGHNFWTVFGTGLNDDNVLEHKILGDDVLCFINRNNSSRGISIEVEYRCELRNIWVGDFSRGQTEQQDGRRGVDLFGRNKEAIFSTVLAKSIRSTVDKENNLYEIGVITLASQKLFATHVGDIT